MQLTELLNAAGVNASRRGADARVVRLTADSRQAGPGCCFVAVRGPSADGHDYIPAAVAAGASSVVCDAGYRGPLPEAFAAVADTRPAVGPLAQALAGWPARRLTLLAVTGTNGKTTVAHLVRHVLGACGRPAGMIGTIGHDVGSATVQAANTTPGPVELADLMARMVQAGCAAAVMEASSHALDQRRACGLDFAAAAFTNLTGDHLDYHGTPERYGQAKARLFADLAPTATAVLNRDDPAWRIMAAPTAARVVTYGQGGGADLVARIAAMDASGSTFDILWDGRRAAVRTNLIGRHNIANLLAAAGLCLAAGEDLDAVAGALCRPIAVPGRLQAVPTGGPFQVVVDYAHTDDAIANVLATLRPLTQGRLIVLFGCGGDRDRTKRPRVARAVAGQADRIVLTQDNPRTEDPQRILDDILAGFDAAARARLTVQPDRREAIRLAIEAAAPGDMVLLAGKGHETYQIIGTTRHPFDDVQVAGEVLAARAGAEVGP
ncbi:MAG: UDP-N-acetylmuramoyl-L-alanyl-D-glutamate--2,6-diaminopimelate ligase [Planctomycetes bacterium]|nr:UDP-N-acetylmuramoyl-L-alanyl-D-glutamate--2,6-diaminopimelate ligase [Planctomycetota bacterium]